jgi:hypothetical protein
VKGTVSGPVAGAQGSSPAIWLGVKGGRQRTLAEMVSRRHCVPEILWMVNPRGFAALLRARTRKEEEVEVMRAEFGAPAGERVDRSAWAARNVSPIREAPPMLIRLGRNP